MLKKVLFFVLLSAIPNFAFQVDCSMPFSKNDPACRPAAGADTVSKSPIGTFGNAAELPDSSLTADSANLSSANAPSDCRDSQVARSVDRFANLYLAFNLLGIAALIITMVVASN